MSRLSEQILQSVEALPVQEQQQVLDFVESLRAKHEKTHRVGTTENETTYRSFFEVAEWAIGAGEGPGDLSTNPD